MASSDMSSPLNWNVEEVQLLRTQLGAQTARLEEAQSETEALRASNGSLERELEDTRTQLAAARAEIGLLSTYFPLCQRGAGGNGPQ